VRLSLFAKLVSAYLLPTFALATCAPLFAYLLTRNALDEEVGKRLLSVARIAAAQQRPDLLFTLQPGDEQSRTYTTARARLEAIREASGASRLYLFTKDRRILVGTGDPLPIGTTLAELSRDRPEIERALEGVPTPSSVTFKGSDGQTYKSAYAPVHDSPGVAAVVLGVDASAEFFDVLGRFGLSTLLLGALFGAAAVGLSLSLNRWVVRPIRALLSSAEKIGKGDLATPITASAKDELGALAEGMDRMRVQLFDRDREQQMMLAGIAHEVRNPLGGIELFAGLLAEDLEKDPERLLHVQRILRELGHLKRVVDDFLDFARDPKLSREQVSASALLGEVAELVRADSQAKEQTLVLSAPDLPFEADPSSLRRALLNLAQNAVQATPRGGTVRLSAATVPGRVRLSVEDDGPGVPDEARTKIFTPFFTTKEKGLGLGLAFVRRIAEAHGGSVKLGDRAKGAVFVIELPVVRSSGE
jgi:signal transduction histidine kinase